MQKLHRKRSILKRESRLNYLILIVMSVACLLPILMVISASLTDETYIQQYGYSLFPKNPTLNTYRFLITNKGKMLLNSLSNTLIVVILGTIYSVLVTTCFAYAVSQKKSVFRFSRQLSFFAWFTTIFSGGVLPWYILCTQYYGLKNNLFALFIPYGMSVWNMYIVRGSFREVPDELIESAKLDGATHFQVFVKIAIPIARAGIVTISLFNVLTFWNDFHLPQWLISDSRYHTLQKLLYSMLANSSALLKDSSLSDIFEKLPIPTQTAKMAVAVMTILPIVALYPFSFKYFVKGINVGGIKG
ncbi:MAG: carbohydrate ABC transporter permease [Clostridiales bacterium]|nr:carbohydrate ABC transporter permease [Clostridiales bacterium]